MIAVILAGGLGTRLKPFTQVIPKPLLPVGESSVLEIQILSLKNCGITKIYIATNYMSEYVQAFLGDGTKYGVQIVFSKEDKPLGTCGPVKLLQDQIDEPFLLMNGDVLTTLAYDRVFQFGLKSDANLTVVTKEVVTPFSFGKVIAEGDYLTHVEEKPTLRIEILGGIYLLKPPIFDLIPSESYYGIDSLIKDMLARGMKVGRYLMKEYWLDIGQADDYQTAQDAYQTHFVHLKNNL